MLAEVQPGTWIDPSEVVGIQDEVEHYPGPHGGTNRYDTYVTLRNGLKFYVRDASAGEVRAILWPDTPSTRTRLTEPQ